MADHTQHRLALAELALDLAGNVYRHVRIGFVVGFGDDDAVAQQPTGAVDLVGGQTHAAQHGLAGVGLKARQRRGDIDGDVAFGRFAGAATGGQPQGAGDEQQDSQGWHSFHGCFL